MLHVSLAVDCNYSSGASEQYEKLHRGSELVLVWGSTSTATSINIQSLQINLQRKQSSLYLTKQTRFAELRLGVTWKFLTEVSVATSTVSHTEKVTSWTVFMCCFSTTSRGKRWLHCMHLKGMFSLCLILACLLMVEDLLKLLPQM